MTLNMDKISIEIAFATKEKQIIILLMEHDCKKYTHIKNISVMFNRANTI